MSAHQSFVAQIQTLVEHAPELFFIALCQNTNLWKVQGYNTLVETSFPFIISVLILPWREERTASHTRVNISVLHLLHDLCGNVIRNHALCGALCSKLRQMPILGILGDVVLVKHIDQLRECRGDPHALLVLDTLHTLNHHFLDDQSKVISRLSLRNLIEVHENGYKRSLTITGHQRDQLVLDRLNSALDLLSQTSLDNLIDNRLIEGLSTLLALLNHVLAQFLTADVHERRKMSQSERLTAVLVARHLCNDLCRHVAGREKAVRLLDHRLADHGSVLKHVLEVD